MALHLTNNRDGFAHGQTEITRFDEAEDNTGIGLGVLKLSSGETLETTTANETAWLLMNGSVRVEAGSQSAEFERHSLFDESASCLHAPAGETVRFACANEVEFTVYSTANSETFPARIFEPADAPRSVGT